MRADALRLALLAAALAAGCTASPELSPRIDGLSPAGGGAGQATPVTIHGGGFYPRAVQASSGRPASIDTTHRAWLDGVELSEVAWVDEGTLRTTIPAGLSLGPHELSVENAHGRRGTLAGAWTVIDPAVLGATARLSRTTASLGQAVTVEVTVVNTGGTAVRGLALSVDAPGSVVTVGALPAAIDLAAGGSATLSVPLTAAANGQAAVGVTASGTEAYSGRDLSASAAAGTLIVQARAALAAELSLPLTIPQGQAFTVTMVVENGGQVAALGVSPTALSLVAGSTATLASLTGPTPPAADIPDGGSATFQWSGRRQAAGTVQFEGGAAGTDANDGGAVVAAAVRSNVGGLEAEVLPVTDDPLGDGTPAAALASFKGWLAIGPRTDGKGFWALNPSTGQELDVGALVTVNLGSSSADNSAWRSRPPATTFGTPGCAKDTTACGPGNEDGRGVLAAGTFSGREWLLYAGTAAHKARYLYLAALWTSPLFFQAVDLGAVLPTNADAPTAVAFTDGRLYAAFTDKSGQKSPYLVALTTAPVLPWLDAVAGTDAVELGAAAMPGLGGSASASSSADPQPRIDAMASFGGGFYLAFGGGVIRSASDPPRSYADHPGDWAVATPPGWASRTSIAATSSVGLTPADRAVPALAAFGSCGSGSCLFLARNVRGTSPSVVPQLWRCDPSLSAPTTRCDPGDWALSVPDAASGGQLTQLGVATHGAVSVLLATASYLYLGFDDAATGAQLYRSAVVPTQVSDWKGLGGCAAGTPGCVGLGGAGFGNPVLTRFLDARAVTASGKTAVYVAAGNGTGPLELFAIPE